MNMSVDPEGMKDATTNAFFSTEKKIGNIPTNVLYS